MQNIFLLIFTAFYHQRLIPLKGNIILNYYYTEAYIGSNKQKISLIVDTGSHMIVFPCEPCKQCGKHENKNFNYESSNTFQKIQPYKNYFDWSCNDSRTKKECYFYQGFMERSIYEGFYAQDNFIFESELDKDEKDKQKTAIFGCAQNETGSLATQKANGIIGLGPRSYKSTLFPPSITQIEYQEKRIDNLSFSLCISDQGGFLKLGDTMSETHLQNAQTVIIDCSNKNWFDQYQVDITQFSVIQKDQW